MSGEIYMLSRRSQLLEIEMTLSPTMIRKLTKYRLSTGNLCLSKNSLFEDFDILLTFGLHKMYTVRL